MKATDKNKIVVNKKTLVKSGDYAHFIRNVKERIKNAQIKAAVTVNSELILLYWDLAGKIVEAQKRASWGDGFLQQLSDDLLSEFPDMMGFSYRNLRYIKQWYLFWMEDNSIWQQPVAKLPSRFSEKTKQSVTALPENSIWQQPVAKLPRKQIGQQLVSQLAQIPWGHNLVILSKAADCEEAMFYVEKTIENNWSRAVLTHQIEGQLYKRKGKAVTNFSAKLPKPQSDLALQIIKDPYNFDFLTIREKYNERELENSLMEQMTKFLLELGAGFSFVGRQYKITVDDEDFYPDLLFYHTRLHCYVVVELKTVKFKPEFAGKLNFYVSAIDDLLKTKQDNPTIGLLICKSKSKMVVEYSLKNVQKPIGVSNYEIMRVLPEKFKSSLPSIEEIEAELSGIDELQKSKIKNTKKRDNDKTKRRSKR